MPAKPSGEIKASTVRSGRRYITVGKNTTKCSVPNSLAKFQKGKKIPFQRGRRLKKVVENKANPKNYLPGGFMLE